MRVAEGSVADFANITWPANANATLSFAFETGLSTLGGIPLNLFVLYLTFRSSLIAGNYKYFLANLAFCDLVASLLNILQLSYHLYSLIYEIPLNITKCYVMVVSSGLSHA